jgi:CubicO group peptidase (beta-lactamase class C family)
MSSRTHPVALALLIAAVTTAPLPASAQRWTLPAETQQKVDAVFDFIDRGAPGCALGVVKDGALAYGRGYGLANLDWGIPLTTSTVFDIGSVSKQFTATALALLDLDGVLSLDDEVPTWIPELPDYGSRITIRHLLNHTSGIRDYLTLQSLAGFEFANVMDEHDGVELIVRQRALNFEPGSEYLYSNSGYLLLANVVRRATGQSLREFLEERVFDPLGMAHTSIWDDNTEIVAERATGYSPGDGWEIDHAWNFQLGGDGQVITSIDDLVKWDANFYDPVVGGTGLLDRLHTQGILNDGDTIEYALGLRVGEYRGLRRVAHGDAVLEDAFTEETTTDRAEADEEESTEPVELDAAQFARWVGVYRTADRPNYWRFEVRDGALHIVAPDEAIPLVARTETSFVMDPYGVPVRFQPQTDEWPEGVRVGSTVFLRQDAAILSGEEQRALVGSYWSPELAVRFDVTRSDGSLWVHRPGRDPERMQPGMEGEFEVGGVAILVRRDESGTITGLEIHAGRVTGLVLEREGT